MFSLVLDFLTGMAVGIEWMGFDPDDEEEGIVGAMVFHLLIVRVSFIIYQND